MKFPQLLSFPLQWLRRDGRHYQLLFLSALLAYGLLFLGWAQEYAHAALRPLFLLGICLSVQAAFVWRSGGDWHSLKSAAITALGLSILCKTGSWESLALAGVLAIGGKFVIQSQGKHVFNPANFGIVAAMLLTGLMSNLRGEGFRPDVWVSPGQWGHGVVLVFAIGAMGATVLLRVGRLDAAAVFFVTLALLVSFRSVVFYGWPWDHAQHALLNGSLALFTCFMITDPVTTPRAKPARMIWAAATAVLAFAMTTRTFSQSFGVQLHAAPVYALFLTTLFVPLLNRWRPAPRFSWSA